MYKYLAISFLILGVRADEVRKRIVTVGKTNAHLVVEVIKSKPTRTPEDQHAYFLALYQAGELNKACQFFLTMDDRIVGKRTRLIYVKALLDLGQAKSAFFQLKKLDDPKRPDLEVELLKAKVFIAAKEWKVARVVLSALVRVDSSNPEVHYLYALTCPSVGAYKEAVASCNRVWELAPPGSKLARSAGALMIVSMKKMGLGVQRDKVDKARKE